MVLNALVPWKKRRQDFDIQRNVDNPFQLFDREIDRIFDSFRSRFDLEPYGFRRNETNAFMPNADVTENEKEVRITCELPGMDEKDIDITLSNDSLTVRGEKKQETKDKGKDYYRIERCYGTFERMIPLPAEIEKDKAQAEFKKGVLEIILPKTAGSRKTYKKIEVIRNAYESSWQGQNETQ